MQIDKANSEDSNQTAHLAQSEFIEPSLFARGEKVMYTYSVLV